MAIAISISLNTEQQKAAVENNKNELDNSKRAEQLARKHVSDQQTKGKPTQAPRKKLQSAQRVRQNEQSKLRANQQKLSLVQQIDRMQEQLDRIEKLKGTDQYTDNAKQQGESLRKRIAQSRKSLKAIKPTIKKDPTAKRRIRRI